MRPARCASHAGPATSPAVEQDPARLGSTTVDAGMKVLLPAPDEPNRHHLGRSPRHHAFALVPVG